jgi:hypothetical protein
MSSTPHWRAVLANIIAAVCGALAAPGCTPASDKPHPPTLASPPTAAASLSVVTPSMSAAAPSTSIGSSWRVATRMTGTSGFVSRHRAQAVIVGERWGCAQITSDGRATWQCWEAHSPQSKERKPPRAFAVPWLDYQHELIAAAHHLCAYEPSAVTLRCWKRPSQRESAGRPLPERGEWLNPHHATFDDMERADRAEAAFVGGTFACLRNGDGEAWCLGSNAFGQRGGAAGREPGSDANVPPLIGVWPAASVALGTWHGCAIASPNAQDFYASCWGRGDLGQLGGPPPDICNVDGRAVGCARSPRNNIRVEHAEVVLRAGDQFTCMNDGTSIRCWGASRDGFFGEPGSCSDDVERQWPTSGGPVSAPHARCSRVPARVPVHHELQREFQVGPRGLCVDGESKLECVGAIPSPNAHGIHDAIISAGQDASACSLRDGTVLCWGEGYSLPNTPNVPVAIELAASNGMTEVAVIGATDPAGWDARCIVRTKCTISAPPLGACGSDVHARDWSEVLSSASKSTGRRISVRGRLEVGLQAMTLAACGSANGRGCCNRARSPLVLGGASESLELQGFFCAGDDSQSCCNAPAFGQSVVASGELVAAPSNGKRMPWILAHAALCSESGTPQ